MQSQQKSTSPDRAPRAIAILSGAVISITAFILLLALMGRFIPLFLRYSGSPWMKLLTPLSVLVIILAGGVTYRLRRRRG